MKLHKMKKWALASIAAFTFMTAQTTAEASTIHEVQTGESIWTLAKKYAVPVNKIKEVNNKQHNGLNIGEQLTIPAPSLTAAEQDLLARLVTAEAKGEPYDGMVAVATVVLNRIDSKDFPNTAKGVVYQVVSGHYAFEPVGQSIKRHTQKQNKR